MTDRTNDVQAMNVIPTGAALGAEIGGLYLSQASTASSWVASTASGQCGTRVVRSSNISSIGGIYATPMLVAYGASKGAVRQLTKSVAAYCGRAGYRIRCNSVHPGITETRMGEEVLRQSDGNVEAGRRRRIEGIPVGRLGRPRDIANAVLYLGSDEASFVNGAELVVDGGQLIQ